MKRALFTLLTVALGLVLLEAGSHLGIRLLDRHSSLSFVPVRERLRKQSKDLTRILEAQGRTLLALHPNLGFVYAPDVSEGRYGSNSLGARGLREYSKRPRPSVLRIAAFGDSFVHANEVADEEAWSAVLEELMPSVEVLNFGVGGYGIDQALLRYREIQPDLGADLILLGFSEPTYARNLNRYRRFLSPEDLPLFKPRFGVREDGRLELIPNPFPRGKDLQGLIDQPRRILMAASDDWFFEPLIWKNPLYDHSAFVRLAASVGSKLWWSRLRPDRLYHGDSMNPDSEGFRLLLALVETFASEVTTDKARFVFVVFPTRASDIWRKAPPAYQPLLDALEGVWIVDLAHGLASIPVEAPGDLFAPGGHYNQLANRHVAAYLRDRLRASEVLGGFEMGARAATMGTTETPR